MVSKQHNLFDSRKSLYFDYQKKPMKISLGEKQKISSSLAIPSN